MKMLVSHIQSTHSQHICPWMAPRFVMVFYSNKNKENGGNILDERSTKVQDENGRNRVRKSDRLWCKSEDEEEEEGDSWSVRAKMEIRLGLHLLFHFLSGDEKKKIQMGPTAFFFSIFFLSHFLLQSKREKMLFSLLFSLIQFLSSLFSLYPNTG